ncbi:hypothetical protein EDEG_00901 [Edhazardia aedis USNM 41457]|uniref:Uncharacterized protein n=1 Tax=Edhazardia aedis (strain USNM 41457) TaxID=1003232 RepID=J9DBW3_EDHAE|nr:hypothetical protein EDEG_00901 [Edhazardia aedis USNM 41457]|eukprot:EJW04984.1 hypothetical protein EDEG_00901 [Edhazardia aedis USNM 41457]
MYPQTLGRAKKMVEHLENKKYTIHNIPLLEDIHTIEEQIIDDKLNIHDAYDLLNLYSAREKAEGVSFFNEKLKILDIIENVLQFENESKRERNKVYKLALYIEALIKVKTLRIRDVKESFSALGVNLHDESANIMSLNREITKIFKYFEFVSEKGNKKSSFMDFDISKLKKESEEIVERIKITLENLFKFLHWYNEISKEIQIDSEAVNNYTNMINEMFASTKHPLATSLKGFYMLYNNDIDKAKFSFGIGSNNITKLGKDICSLIGENVYFHSKFPKVNFLTRVKMEKEKNSSEMVLLQNEAEKDENLREINAYLFGSFEIFSIQTVLRDIENINCVLFEVKNLLEFSQKAESLMNNRFQVYNDIIENNNKDLSGEEKNILGLKNIDFIEKNDREDSKRFCSEKNVLIEKTGFSDYRTFFEEIAKLKNCYESKFNETCYNTIKTIENYGKVFDVNAFTSKMNFFVGQIYHLNREYSKAITYYKKSNEKEAFLFYSQLTNDISILNNNKLDKSMDYINIVNYIALVHNLYEKISLQPDIDFHTFYAAKKSEIWYGTALIKYFNLLDEKNVDRNVVINNLVYFYYKTLCNDEKEIIFRFYSLLKEKYPQDDFKHPPHMKTNIIYDDERSALMDVKEDFNSKIIYINAFFYAELEKLSDKCSLYNMSFFVPRKNALKLFESLNTVSTSKDVSESKFPIKDDLVCSQDSDKSISFNCIPNTFSKQLEETINIRILYLKTILKSKEKDKNIESEHESVFLASQCYSEKQFKESKDLLKYAFNKINKRNINSQEIIDKNKNLMLYTTLMLGKIYTMQYIHAKHEDSVKKAHEYLIKALKIDSNCLYAAFLLNLIYLLKNKLEDVLKICDIIDYDAKKERAHRKIVSFNRIVKGLALLFNKKPKDALEYVRKSGDPGAISVFNKILLPQQSTNNRNND